MTRCHIPRGTTNASPGGVGDPAGRRYIRDLQAGTTTLLPLLFVDGQQPSLSADGQRVAYNAPATLPSSGGAVLTMWRRHGSVNHDG